MNTQSLLLSSTFLFSQVHSFATTGVCPCLEFLMITQAPDRNSISLDVFLYNLTRVEAWIMASGNHNLVFPSSPSSPRRNFIAAVHYPPFSSSSHSSHDNLPIASFWVVAWFTFLIICISDMFFPRRSCGSILGIFTVSLLFGSSKRLVRSRNHRWSWSISCFGSVFGTAFSVPPV